MSLWCGDKFYEVVNWNLISNSCLWSPQGNWLQFKELKKLYTWIHFLRVYFDRLVPSANIPIKYDNVTHHLIVDIWGCNDFCMESLTAATGVVDSHTDCRQTLHINHVRYASVISDLFELLISITYLEPLFLFKDKLSWAAIHSSTFHRLSCSEPWW